MRHDRSVAVTDVRECDGSSLWSASYEPLLAERCAFGNDPCANGAGLDAASMRCDAQCVSPLVRGARCDGAANLTLRRTQPWHAADDADDGGLFGLNAWGSWWVFAQLSLGLLLVCGIGVALLLSAPWDLADYP